MKTITRLSGFLFEVKEDGSVIAKPRGKKAASEDRERRRKAALERKMQRNNRKEADTSKDQDSKKRKADVSEDQDSRKKATLERQRNSREKFNASKDQVFKKEEAEASKKQKAQKKKKPELSEAQKIQMRINTAERVRKHRRKKALKDQKSKGRKPPESPEGQKGPPDNGPKPSDVWPGWDFDMELAKMDPHISDPYGAEPTDSKHDDPFWYPESADGHPYLTDIDGAGPPDSNPDPHHHDPADGEDSDSFDFVPPPEWRPDSPSFWELVNLEDPEVLREEIEREKEEKAKRKGGQGVSETKK